MISVFDKFGARQKPYTICAVFGGSDGLKDSTGTVNLTVAKAQQTAAPEASTQNPDVPATANTVTLNAVTGSDSGYGYGTVDYGYTDNNQPVTEIDTWQKETRLSCPVSL